MMMQAEAPRTEEESKVEESKVEEPAEAPDVPHCRRKGCRSTAPLFSCSNPGCSRHIHMTCYYWYCNRNQVDPIDEGYCCTKACHGRVKKVNGGDQVRVTWNNDGLKGEDDPHTSMSILLNWMLAEGNYAKYRGKHNDGKKKKQIQVKLAEKMTAETKSQRDFKQVERKIRHMKSLRP